MKDAQLVKDTKGIYRLSAKSPAIGTADAGFKVVSVDMDAQPRKGKWDTGADQYMQKKSVAQVLQTGQVGAGANQ
ncbi:hypothetical protein [Niabella hibiscisoli]|uniref:hypothetical protein n=1 Tax=Niabella hibiscisoli TaxID=1825928 RepID=UPI001F0D7AF4|nr:hypothetical protein [Niabella hibiscisoli]MCH5720787.1 hypothetical protein [Niabella hibiscisoli]